MKVHIVSLGCPKNLVDSENILGELKRRGAKITFNPQEADAIVINTCGFIEDAKKESIETIFQAVRLKEQGNCRRLIVTGCLSQRYRQELEQGIPEVDAYFGARSINDEQRSIAETLGLTYCNGWEHAREVTTAPVYAYLKIAEGCDNRCSFCAIPLIRGPYQSRPMDEIVTEARRLITMGIQELILVAQDTTYYGQDLGQEVELADLVEVLSQIEGVRWLRLLYTYPNRITDRLIDVIAEHPNVCKYLDVPIQHISDRILKRMLRGTNRREIETIIEKLCQRIPDLAIRTTVMVGFPGESDSDFQQLYDFVETSRFERLGVFQFSPEEGTPAFDFRPQVPENVKQERYDALMALQQEISWEENQRLVGEKLLVHIDRFDDEKECFQGRTEWDSPEIDNCVYVKGEVNEGEFYSVLIQSATQYELYGIID